MIDVGLVVTMFVALGVPSLVAKWWPLATFDGLVGFLDVAIWPAFVGLGVGRLVAVGMDGPTSLGSLSDLLIMRSGVEFWPGVAAAMLVAAWSARRTGAASLDRLADLVPLALIGYAGYEVTCLVRDGCYGLESSLGLRPPGTSTEMLPVGILAAIALVVDAVVLHRLLGRLAPWIVVTGGLAVVAGVRSVAAIWLPHIGEGLTRQHWSSIAVFAIGVVALAAALVARRAATGRCRVLDAATTDRSGH